MRIKSIDLSWFRGASDHAILDTQGKSVVVYGSNGAGKSSFVDAVEHVLRDGKIEHLAHEYSGTYNKKAVPNTHTPEDEETSLRISFLDGSSHETVFLKNGSFTKTQTSQKTLDTWEYKHTILRQNEVAAFIQSSKGNKYSALLPLFGLDQMETAAENLRKIGKNVAQESHLSEKKSEYKRFEIKRTEVFGADSDDQVVTQVKSLHTKYCSVGREDKAVQTIFEEIEESLSTRVNSFSVEQRSHYIIAEMASINLGTGISSVQSVNRKLTRAVEPFIKDKLKVLESASDYISNLKGVDSVDCPACGREIKAETFCDHITTEQTRLSEIIDIFNEQKRAVAILCSNLGEVHAALSKDEVLAWRIDQTGDGLSDNFKFLDNMDIESIRKDCKEEMLEALQNNLLPIIEAARVFLQKAPPDTRELLDDKERASTAHEIIKGAKIQDNIQRIELLISFIETVERKMRDRITVLAEKVINEISSDIQNMWSMLHPNEKIEEVSLYLPKNDKAIDIGLKFYGIEQDSPRLTLSEGHRNSLGLCVFFAMAKRVVKIERPLILDDVVVSLDRGHRGMIAEVLEKEFPDKQVIIFTHDRDWYMDLRTQLDPTVWRFKSLLPWKSPEKGIQWSHSTNTFDDARSLLKIRPDSAGNDARKIMDVEFALIAEKLQIKFPYLRGEKNDKRMAFDFLQRIISAGKKCFQIENSGNYQKYDEALKKIEISSGLLSSWGNRASHTNDLVTAEAEKLIHACEAALDVFTCSSCKTRVWYAAVSNLKLTQCKCSSLRWCYGKNK